MRNLHRIQPGAGIIILLMFLVGCTEKPLEFNDIPEVDLSRPTDLFDSPFRPGNTGSTPSSRQIIGTVDGQPIHADRLQREVDVMLSRLRTQMPPERIEQEKNRIFNQALENLIVQMILQSKVKESGLTVPDEQMAQAIESIKLRLPEGTDLDAHLRKAGITQDQLREQIKGEQLLNLYVNRNLPPLEEPKEEDITSFYQDQEDQFKMPEMATALHLVIPLKQDAGTEKKGAAKTQLEAVMKRVLAGQPFEEMVQKIATDNDSAIKGGRSDFPRNNLAPAVEKALFDQPVGVIGEIVESPFGVHLFQVVERKPARNLSLEETRPQIKALLERTQKQQAVQQFVRSLREAADVQMNQAESAE